MLTDLQEFALLVIALVAAIYGVRTFIKKTVDEKLKHPDTLRALASNLNPTLIIDSQGTVLYDRGGWDLLEELNVILEQENPEKQEAHRHPEQIIILPKKPMVSAPLVSVVDPWEKIPIANRGKGITWVVTFVDNGSSLIAWGDDNRLPPRFKLEFIQ